MSLTATPSPGTFTSPQLVTLTDASADSIFYTVDGSSPSYTGSYRDWNDGLLTNQTGVSSNAGATFTNPGTWLRQTHSAAVTSAVSFLDFVPQSQDFTASFRFRFNSASCSNDTSAALVYRCTGKYAANDTYGYVASVWRYGVGLGRGSNKSTGAYTSVASAAIASPLAYDTWHTLTVTVSGSRHRISVNGVDLLGADDNTFMFAGYVGFRSWSPSGTAVVDFDNLLLESVGGTTKRYTAPIPVVPGTVAATTIKAVSVLKGVALAGPPVTGAKGTYTDARDGRVYKTVYMPDGKWWSAENLAWAGAGLAHLNAGLTTTYGRQYRTVDLEGSSPATGTHYPTYSELQALASAVQNDSNKLKSVGTTYWQSSGGLDTYGFDFRGAGSYNSAGTWTSNLTQEGYLVGVGSGGCRLRATHGLNTFSLGNNDTNYGSVRFIVDSGNVPDGGGSTVTDFAYTLPVRAQAPTATVSGTAPNAVVTLASATPGASLYYTTDGSTPKVTVSAPATPVVGATGKFTDARDGKVYKTVYMPDGKWWSAENLVWNDASYTTVVSGRYFYRPSDHAAIAPTGSHVPTSAEFNALVAAIGSSAGAKLRTTTGWPSHDGVLVPGTDDYGFGLTPTGYINGGSQYEWDYGGHLGAQSTVGGDVESYGTGSKTDGIGLVISGYSTTTVRAIRFIVDSGNVPDTVTTVSGTQYTASFPYLLGQPVTAIARAAGYLDSLPVRLYPVATVSGIVIGTGYLSTNNTVPYSGYRALWLRSIPYGQNTQAVTELTPWLTSTTYRFYGTILGTPAAPIGTASTKQPTLFPDQGIQISVFPRQPTIYDNRVDWGNGPVTNRSLKVTWRVPQNDQFLFASTKTDVKKAVNFGALDIVSQSDTWAIGGASATATLATPSDAHYLDVSASLGFVSGTATPSQAVRVTGGRNSSPMAIWLSPGAGNVRLNIPIQCNIAVSDPDLDLITYAVTANGTQIQSGTASNGTVLSFLYTPTATGALSLVVTLTDPFGFQSVTPAPALTVLNNAFPTCVFQGPVSGTAVYKDTNINILFDIADTENELMTWILLNNNVTIASGTSSNATTTQYRFKVPAGTNDISLVLADPLGAAPAFTGPTIYGALCQITDVTPTGKLENGSAITLTPTITGTPSSVQYAITTASGTVNLSSSTAPYSVVWTPSLTVLPDTAVIVATALDSTGHGPSVTKNLPITGSTLVGSLFAVDSPDSAQAYGSVIAAGNMFAVDTVDTFYAVAASANSAIRTWIASTVPHALSAGAPLVIEAEAQDDIENVSALTLEYQLPGTSTWVSVPMQITEL